VTLPLLLLLLLNRAWAAPVRVPQDAPGLEIARAMNQAFVEVARAVTPATVYIEAIKGDSTSPGLLELSNEYRLPLPGGRGETTPSSGSGALISADGLILTNHHVIAGAKAAVVTLHDQRSYHAEIVAVDARTDLALLRVKSEQELPWAELAENDDLAVGELVVAVGHPFDFPFTVTTGIVSARGRRNLFRNEIQDYIQTDTALNPGSSGGPLFNLRGQIVGVNTAIFTPPGSDGQYAGVSFAIPSPMARRIVDELLEAGRVARASLGLSTRDRPASGAQPKPGVEVTRVVPGGPADKAGLRAGDVVRQVDGESILGSEDLRGLVLARGVATSLELSWERGGRTMSARVRTGEEVEVLAAKSPPPSGAMAWAGLRLVALNEQGASVFALPAPLPERGVLVWSVDPGSPSEMAGVRPGDVLVGVGPEPLGLPAELLLAAAKRGTVSLRLWRDGEELWAVVAGLR